MENRISPSVLKFGKWAAIFSSIFSISYVVGQLAEWLDLLGSGGGPENASTALGLIVLLTPSLFLAVSFVILMVGIHYYSPLDCKSDLNFR